MLFQQTLTIGLLLWSLALPASGETVLEKIQRTGVVKVAIREDAAPFGYLDDRGNLQGYCLDFFRLLEQKLTATLERNSVIVRLFKSNTANRFALVASNIVYLECGPNTIRADAPDNTKFSDGFFITGTQFLTTDRVSDFLDLEENLENIILGVLSDTTTEELIKERYPSAKLALFRGSTGRNRGVQALQQGRIDAMASDGILLRAEALQQGLSTAKYPLIPELPLTCDRYGMIITDDPQWQDFINSIITSSELAAVANNWFSTLDPYTQVTEDYCKTNFPDF